MVGRGKSDSNTTLSIRETMLQSIYNEQVSFVQTNLHKGYFVVNK